MNQLPVSGPLNRLKNPFRVLMHTFQRTDDVIHQYPIQQSLEKAREVLYCSF